MLQAVSTQSDSGLQKQDQKGVGPEQLGKAFEQFNQLSQQLSESYGHLENRVSELTAELNEVSQQRRQAVQEKESLATRLNELIDFLPGGVVVLNSDGRVEQCNPAAITLLGEPLEGELWFNVIKRSFLPRVDDGHEVSTIDGRRLGISTGAMQAQGQIVLITDLTHTRELQDRLSRQERLASMGKMVSALAHQIRTPLSSAMLYSSQLLNAQLPANKRQQFSLKLSQRLEHMEQQVRDMLLFVKGDLAVNDRLPIRELEQSLRAAMDDVIDTQTIHCRWYCDCPDKVLRCNKDVLVGALMNLVNNAVQSCPQNLKLEIHMKLKEKATLNIAVIDNGPGIEADQLHDCQQAFVTTKSTGLGLGLNIVNIVAKAHGGRFDISAPKQGGTEASLFLPLSHQ